MGGTGIEPVTPKLVDSEQGSDPFAGVRLIGIVEPKGADLPNGTEPERTTNVAIVPRGR